MASINRRFRNDTTRSARIWRAFWTLLLCIGILSVVVLEVYRFAGGFRYWWQNREMKQRYVQEVDRLQQEHQNLKEEVRKLKYNTLTQERLAREMGYVRPGEVVYKFTARTHDATSKP